MRTVVGPGTFQRALCSVVFAVALWLGNGAPLAAQTPDSRQHETIAPGIEHTEIKRGNFADAGKERWTIHVLTVNPKHARLQLAQAMDEIAGAETTTSLARRHGALAAINGGYFRTDGIVRGEPVGLLVLAGKLLSEPVKQRAALAVRDDGRQLQTAIVHVGWQAELRINGQSHPISGFNRPREADELLVFTPEFHRTTLTDANGLEAIVIRNRVTAIHETRGSQPIPAAGMVLSASGKARAWLQTQLRRGARVELKTELQTRPTLSFQPDFILGAGPQLLSAGRDVSEAEAANYSTSLYRVRHPRTAIGWRADGTLLLVTVDGRQPQKSVGMTLAELAALMRELGCEAALNLDGGGSTTMVVKQKIVNSPSDRNGDPAGERPVSDALLIKPR